MSDVAPNTDPIAAQRQFLSSVEGVPDYFARFSGGNRSADTSRQYDGGKLEPEVLASPAQTENITLGRPWKPVRDGEVARRLRTLVGRGRFTVTKQPTDADLVPIGKPIVYPDALLVGLNEPEADASSGDAAALELVFAVARTAD